MEYGILWIDGMLNGDERMPHTHTGSQPRLQSTPLKPQHTVYGPASQTAKRSTVNVPTANLLVVN